ncbi:hypothetical protein MKW94_025425 [Papaver nudicaule]|uniref:Uncharacterized protein n=1 Tax=Papaver nudicaule TaxID=74823 RepID=A0AA41RWK5_PAPNU|nr:hypothetical protein [Papaver nudicaule]
MRTSDVDNDARVSILLPSPGTGQNDKTNPRSEFWKWCLQILRVTEEVKLTSDDSLPKLADQFNIEVDEKCCQNKDQNKEPVRTAYKYYSGGGNPCIGNTVEEVRSPFSCFPLKSTMEVNANVGKYGRSKEASAADVECHSGGSSFHAGDYHCRECWLRESKDRFLEVLSMVSAFLLSFGTAGAFYFTQALTIVGSHDPVLKHTFTTLNWVFAASFFCNFLGVLISLILQSRREYHRYKKLSLIISNIASFLFMVLGYGLLMAFNIGHR